MIAICVVNKMLISIDYKTVKKEFGNSYETVKDKDKDINKDKDTKMYTNLL